MTSKIEITQELAVIRSDTIKMKTKSFFVEDIDSTDDDDGFNFPVQPGDIILSIPPSSLQSLDGELLHLKFTGIVNVIPPDPQNVQPMFMKCFAESNVNWYWKSGLSQPDNRVDGVATVLYTQYAKYINASDDFVIHVSMDVDLGASPQKEVDRIGYGSRY